MAQDRTESHSQTEQELNRSSGYVSDLTIRCEIKQFNRVHKLLTSAIPAFQDAEEGFQLQTSIRDHKNFVLQRAQSITDAAILALKTNSSNTGLGEVKKLSEAYKAKLKKLNYQLKDGDLDYNLQYLSQHTQELVDVVRGKIKDSQGVPLSEKHALKLIQKSESYSTLARGANSVASASIHDNGNIVLQVEQTIPSLTEPLLSQYQAIKDDKKPKPAWFYNSDRAHQSLLVHSLKEVKSVEEFFHTAPSTLRGIPMPANLRIHHLLIIDPQDNIIKKSTRIRSSNMASRDAHDKDRVFHAESNMKAIIALKPDAEVVLFQSLISPQKLINIAMANQIISYRKILKRLATRYFENLNKHIRTKKSS